MKATKTIITALSVLAVASVACRKEEDVYSPAGAGSEIVLGVVPDTEFVTKAAQADTTAAFPPDSLEADGMKSEFCVEYVSMEDGRDDTKATAVTSVPATLKWLCTTGATGSQASKYSMDVTVSAGKARTGKYQTATPTNYSHYLSNAAMSITGAGVTVSADGSSDIVAGTAASSSATPSVAMKHILARTGTVTVNLPAGAPADCSMDNLAVTIRAVTGGTSGTYNLNTDSWSGVSGLTAATALTGTSDMYLVPGQYTVSVSFTLRKGTGGWNVSRTGTITLKGGCINNITLNNTDIVTHEVEITKYSGSLKVGDTSWFLVKYYTRTNGVKDGGADVSGNAGTTITASNSNVKFYYPSVSSDYTKKNGVIGVAPGNVRLTATYGGVSGYIDVTIADKTLTKTEHEYQNVKFTVGSIADIPATGGTSAAPAVSNVTIDRRDKYTWSDGTVTYGDWAPVSIPSYYSVRYSKTNNFADFSTTHTGFTAANLGTTTKPRTKIGTMHVIVLAMASGDMPDVYSATAFVDVYQAANNVTVKGTWYEYSKPWFNLGNIADVSAAGGTSAPPVVSSVGQQRRLVTWWSNDAKDYGAWENFTPSYSVRYSQTNVFANFSTTHTGFTAGSLGSTVKDRTKLGTMYVILLANDVYSDTQYKDVYQQANAITHTTVDYAAPTFTLGNIADVSAAGGTSAAPAVSGVSQQARSYYTYTSGAHAYGSYYTLSPAPTYTTYYSKNNSSWSTSHTGYTGSNLGYTAKARTKLGTIYVYVAANGKNAASKSADAYQAANTVTYSDITISQFSYATPAWNSTETVTPTLTYSQTVRSDALPTPAAATGLTKTFSHSNTAEFSMNGTTGGIKVDAIPTTAVWDTPAITDFNLSPNPAPATASAQTVTFNYSQNRRWDIPDRSDVATVTISGNGKSATKTATRTQKGNKDVLTTESGSFGGGSIPSSAPYTATLEKVGTNPVGFWVGTAGSLTTTWGANGSKQRTAEVKMTFTMNGKSTVAYVTSVQSAKVSSTDPKPTYTVAIDKSQLYVELCHQSSGGTTYNNYSTDKFTVRSNGTDVTSSCTKTGYDTNIISVDANGTVHFVGDGETTITVTYTDPNGDKTTFNVHVRSYEYWEDV